MQRIFSFLLNKQKPYFSHLDNCNVPLFLVSFVQNKIKKKKSLYIYGLAKKSWE